MAWKCSCCKIDHRLCDNRASEEAKERRLAHQMRKTQVVRTTPWGTKKTKKTF